jgi:hypothetical protein
LESEIWHSLLVAAEGRTVSWAWLYSAASLGLGDQEPELILPFRRQPETLLEVLLGLGVVTQKQQGQSPPRVSDGVSREDADVLAAVFQDGRGIPLHIGGHDADDLRRREPGVEPEGRPVVVGRQPVAQVETRVAAGYVGHAQARVDLEGLVVVGDGTGEVARGVARPAPTVIDRSRRLAGSQAQGLVIVDDGALVIAEGIPGRTPADVAGGRVRFEQESLSEVGNSPFEIAQRVSRGPPVVVNRGRRMPRRPLESVVEVSDGPHEIAQGMPRSAPVTECKGVARLQHNGTIEIDDGRMAPG